jgi:hypothetical protein
MLMHMHARAQAEKAREEALLDHVRSELRLGRRCAAAQVRCARRGTRHAGGLLFLLSFEQP